MSVFYRKEIYREKIFLKSLHLKKCKEKLKLVLPQNFSKQDVLLYFQQCFPCVWEDIVSYCHGKQQDYERRSKAGLRTVPCYSPQQFLFKHIGKINMGGTTILEDERLRNMSVLIQNGKDKMQKRRDNLANKLIYVQQVCPSYIQKLIQSYFDLRKEDSLNINARYLILLEAGQFRCKETVQFLHKINACEKNHDLRIMAFKALQRMGEHPWLARGRKGKAKLTQVKPVDIKKNPTELMNFISTYQYLLYQKYDFFLSHSCRDVSLLLKLKSILNSKGYTVYIDWVNDRDMLNRENQDANTWNVLFMRIDQSDRMLYVLTDNSKISSSTEKEVLYCQGKGKKVYCYQPEPLKTSIPSYLHACVFISSLDDIRK